MRARNPFQALSKQTAKLKGNAKQTHYLTLTTKKRNTKPPQQQQQKHARKSNPNHVPTTATASDLRNHSSIHNSNHNFPSFPCPFRHRLVFSIIGICIIPVDDPKIVLIFSYSRHPGLLFLPVKSVQLYLYNRLFIVSRESFCLITAFGILIDKLLNVSTIQTVKIPERQRRTLAPTHLCCILSSYVSYLDNSIPHKILAIKY